MPVEMKAICTFRGQDIEGRPRKGRPFMCRDETRAKELELHNLAIRAKAEDAPLNKMEPAPLNKVDAPAENKDTVIEAQGGGAGASPLFQAGGETGAQTSPSSSAPVRQPQRRGSRRRGAKPAS